MKMYYIILSLIMLSFLNCNKSKAIIENPILLDSVDNKNEILCTTIEVVDSFIINRIQFMTINILYKDSVINGIKLSRGSYLVSLFHKLNSIILIDSINSAYLINNRYMEKNYFFDISNKLDLGMQAVLKYAYPGDGPADVSENYILYVQKDKLIYLCHFTHWDYYYSDLNITKSNNSIYSLKYTERDRYGYFHHDYLIEFNKNEMKVQYVTPDIQETHFKTALLDTLIVYKTKDEANNQKAFNDPIKVYPGEFIIIDSIYWRLNILKIGIIKGSNGFVNMDEIGKSIDTNRAG
jgi:hypothetical protein